MRVLIIGGKGWISGYFIKELERCGNTIIIYEGRAEKLSMEDLIDVDYVFCCVGRTYGMIEDGTFVNSIDYLEYPGKLVENINDNLYAQIHICLLCKLRGVGICIIGTGCIYNNVEGEEFYGSSYCVVKNYCEKILCDINYEKMLMFRIRMPVCNVACRGNLITKLLGYKKIAGTYLNSITYLDNLVPIMTKMICVGEYGIYNAVNIGGITHNDILGIYKSLKDPHYAWETFDLIEQSEKLKSGRSNVVLDSSKISKFAELNGMKLLNSYDAIYNAINNYCIYSEKI